MAQERKNGNSDKSMTAVEWLVNELQLHGYDHTINRAKEIEKEQAFELFKAGQDSMEEGGKNFEQYYGKYNSNKLDKK